MAIDRKKFFEGIRQGPFPGSLSPETVRGVTAILDEWERRKLTDLRWLAYMLATVLAECGRNMLPVREGFKATDAQARAYVASKHYKYAKVEGGQVYYGRGLVQLTWLDNYRKMSQITGIDLVANPDRALEPAVAAKIMFEGMIRGTFTGKKLADFFNATATDWTNARTIINRLDRAAEIAGYAKQFHDDLKAADRPTVVDIAKTAGRDAGIGGAAAGAGKAGETAATTPDAPILEILIAIVVVGVLVFAASFAWRWWKARQAASDSAATLGASDAEQVSDTPQPDKRLSKAENAVADDLAAGIAAAAKARVSVAQVSGHKPRRKRKLSDPKRPAKKPAKRTAKKGRA